MVDGDLRARLIPGPLLRRVAERTLGRSGAAAGNPAGVAPSTFVLVHCMVGILRCAAVLPLVSCSTHGMTPSRTNSYVLRSICACQSGIRACVACCIAITGAFPGSGSGTRRDVAAPFWQSRPFFSTADLQSQGRAVRFHGQQMQIVFTVQNTVLHLRRQKKIT